MQAQCGCSTKPKHGKIKHLRQGRVQRSNPADAAKVDRAYLNAALVVVPAGALGVSSTHHACTFKKAGELAASYRQGVPFANAHSGISHTESVRLHACSGHAGTKYGQQQVYIAAVLQAVILLPCYFIHTAQHTRLAKKFMSDTPACSALVARLLLK